MSFPAVSGLRRRSRDDWLRMDDTVAASDAPPAVDFSRVIRPMLVDGEIIFYEYDYQPPPSPDYGDMDYLRRTFREEDARLREQQREDLALHARNRKRARALASGDDAIQRCLREARAGDAGMPEDCAVCLQDFNANAKETIRVTPCSHAFHADCIFTWLRVKPVCPLCRRDLPSKKHKDQDFEDEDDDSDQDSDQDDTDSDEDDTDSDEDEDTDDAVNYQQERTLAVPDLEEP